MGSPQRYGDLNQRRLAKAQHKEKGTAIAVPWRRQGSTGRNGQCVTALLPHIAGHGFRRSLSLFAEMLFAPIPIVLRSRGGHPEQEQLRRPLEAKVPKRPENPGPGRLRKAHPLEGGYRLLRWNAARCRQRDITSHQRILRKSFAKWL